MLCRWPEASFDNMAAQMLSQTLKRKKYETWAPIKKWDFQGSPIGNLPKYLDDPTIELKQQTKQQRNLFGTPVSLFPPRKKR